MKRAFVIMFVLVAIFVLASAVFGQAQGLTNNDVLAFWKQGLSETFLLNEIQKNSGAFAMGPDDVRALVAAKVPNSVIEAMSAKAGTAMPTPPTPATLPTTSAATNTNWPASAAETTISYRPDNGTNWTPLATEAVSWTRDGAGKLLKKVATAGIAGRPFTGTLSGPSSVSVLSNPPEFVIDVATGGSPNTWALVALEKNKKNRAVTDPAHRALMIHMVERRANQYRMRSDNDLSPGEYALVNLNAQGDEAPSGMICTFRVR